MSSYLPSFSRKSASFHLQLLYNPLTSLSQTPSSTSTENRSSGSPGTQHPHHRGSNHPCRQCRLRSRISCRHPIRTLRRHNLDLGGAEQWSLLRFFSQLKSSSSKNGSGNTFFPFSSFKYYDQHAYSLCQCYKDDRRPTQAFELSSPTELGNEGRHDGVWSGREHGLITRVSETGSDGDGASQTYYPDRQIRKTVKIAVSDQGSDADQDIKRKAGVETSSKYSIEYYDFERIC